MDDIVNIFLILALIVLGYLIYKEEKEDWEVFHEATGYAVENAHRKFKYLRKNGVRCRLKTATGRRITRLSVGDHTAVKIEVHKKDLDKAKKLMQYQED